MCGVENTLSLLCCIDQRIGSYWESNDVPEVNCYTCEVLR